MSTVSSGQPEFDFWDFVNCTRCQLPFVSAAIPFWLTECGHVICNNHLSHDQSCVQCGARGIQLIPLQREMESPMSEWFRSIPYSLDAAAYAAKFQQESMASQIRNLKSRCQQQRQFIDQLKGENTELRRRNEMLAAELTHIRPSPYESYGPSTFVNGNGKRPMTANFHPSTSSSPVGPNRITLPPGQQPPHLSSTHEDRSGINERYQSTQEMTPQEKQAYDRPGSSRFAQQYSYVPISEPQSIASRPHPHAQPHPRQFQRTRPESQQVHPQSKSSRPVTTLSAKFKSPSASKDESLYRAMGPPPTPQHVNQRKTLPNTTPVLPTSRFQPANSGFQSSAIANPKEFVAPKVTRAPFPTSNAAGSRAPSRAHPDLSSGSGQRKPFVPR